MRIKDGFKLVNLQGQNTVIPDNSNSGSFNNTIVLTDTAVFLWKMLEKGSPTKTEMLNALLDNFDISTVLALGDIDIFLRTMKENGIIEE